VDYARWRIGLAMASIIFPPLPSLTVLGDLYPVSTTRNFMNCLPRLAYPYTGRRPLAIFAVYQRSVSSGAA
jgi:hypothetical protein